MITTLSRFRGALLGLAVGDALGTSLEFTRPGSFAPIDDIIGGGPFKLEPGEWTDDTSMALCLAESLVETAEFDLSDQLRRYLHGGRGLRGGRCSSQARARGAPPLPGPADRRRSTCRVRRPSGLA
jgi:ADP-ribosyl-[dinitrogen reductase] hydrolase